MKLTGQCKADFEKWYDHNYEFTFVKDRNQGSVDIGVSWQFYELPFSTQWGVYLQFFDGVGIGVTNQPSTYGGWIAVVQKGFEAEHEIKKTRQEAQQAAIEKANAIYNQTTNQ